MIAHPTRRTRRTSTQLDAGFWKGDLPRPLQQILFDAADGIASPEPARFTGPQPAAIGL
jgi:hypothetical protein